MNDNTYGCDKCSGRFDWDNEIIWVTSEVGFCDKCYDEIKTDKVCPKCECCHLFKSDLPEYDYVCYECDENFYSCEVE